MLCKRSLIIRLLASFTFQDIQLKNPPWPESASELDRPSDRRFSTKLVPTFTDKRCHVVSVTNPYGRNLHFLDRSRYFFFQVAPQLYSRGWVDLVPDPRLLWICGSAGNRARTSGSVARKSDHWTTEAVENELPLPITEHRLLGRPTSNPVTQALS
jgi:hypothetical protein